MFLTKVDNGFLNLKGIELKERWMNNWIETDYIFRSSRNNAMYKI